MDARPDDSRPPPRGLGWLARALGRSLGGLRIALREDAAFRLAALLAACLVPLACLLPVAPVERALLIVPVLLHLVVELLNSSIEAAVDRIGSEAHELSRMAKDLAAAAVFVAVALLLAAWILIAGPLIPGL